MSRNNAIQTVTFTTLADFQAGGQVTNGTVLNTPTPGDDGSITTTNANPSKAASLVSWWSMDAYTTDPTTGISWIDDSKVGGNNTAIVYPLTLSGTPAPTLADSRFGKSIQLNITGVPVPPIGWWKLEESGSPSIDSSGNANNGTWSGNTAISAGKYGMGVTLDGSGDYISIPSITGNSSTQTVEAWVYIVGAVSGNQYVIDQGGNNNWIQIYNSKIRAGNSGSYYCDGATTLTTNTWYHIAKTFDGVTMKVYLNAGVSPDCSISASGNTPGAIRVGDYSGGGYALNGKVDDVRIYNYARTQPQIEIDMNGTSTVLDENNLSHLRVTNNLDLGASNAPFSWEYMVKPTGTTTKPVIAWGALGTTPS
jgi:hypothetical protein